MKSIIRLLLIILFIFFSVNTTAQNRPQAKKIRPFLENVRFGGAIGLNFGNNFFSGTLAPVALYEINPYVLTGVGLNFSYSSFSDNDLLVYGGSLVSIVRPVEEIQFSMEFEQLRVNRSFDGGTFEENYWYPALFLGLGYTSGSVTFGVRYDVLYNERRSLYANAFMPFVRVLL